MYSVKQGDTLWSIAQSLLGDGLRWRELWKLNHERIDREQLRYPEARRCMRGPDWIFPGTELVLPAA